MAPQQTGLCPYRKREPHRTCALALCCRRSARRQLRARRTALPRNCAGRSLDRGLPGCDEFQSIVSWYGSTSRRHIPELFMQTEPSHARRLVSLPGLGERLEGRFFSYASRRTGRSALELSLRTGVRRKLTVSHAGRVTRAATLSLFCILFRGFSLWHALLPLFCRASHLPALQRLKVHLSRRCLRPCRGRLPSVVLRSQL